MIDYGALLYGPNYLILGVEAVLTLPATDGAEITLTALDKTAGVEIGGSSVDGRDNSFTTVQTILPAAVVRASELLGVDLTDLEDSRLAMNGKTWRVKSYMLKPSPKGEGDGEIYLILSEQ